jgi:CrcB protein|tara:strand:- start:834 stop:1205 length:372 start_codon:yes stop_codon:yes gene_type:complete
MSYLLIAIGGAGGAITRYSIDKLTMYFGMENIVGTFIVNMSGSFILGLLISISTYKLNFSNTVRDAITIGFLGSFTTFSTLTVTSLNLWQSGQYVKASLNIILSIIFGLIAAYAGYHIGNQVS